MTVKGFQGTSLLDFPGRLASLIFFGGCNLRCAYCHNPSLLENPSQLPDYPLEVVFDELERRRGFVDGVVVSGGEPTLSPELLPLLRRIKALGLAVKLDSNGLRPDVLRSCRDEALVDYLALDLKTDPARYAELGGCGDASELLRQSLSLIGENLLDGEIRTTCVPGLVESADIQAMGAFLCRDQDWVLQGFVPRYAMEAGMQDLEPHSKERMEQFREMASVHVRTVKLRGL